MNLHHLVLQTGHLRISPRAEVAPAALAGLRELVAAATAKPGRAVSLPGTDGWFLTAGEVHGVLIFSLWPPTAKKGDDPVASCVCARTSTPATSAIYRHLREEWRERIPVADPELPTPWLVADLDLVQLTAWPDATPWLGDCERSIAWAWLVGD